MWGKKKKLFNAYAFPAHTFKKGGVGNKAMKGWGLADNSSVRTSLALKREGEGVNHPGVYTGTHCTI